MNIPTFATAVGLVLTTGAALGQTAPTPGTAIPTDLSFSIQPTPASPVPLNLQPTSFARPGEVGLIVYHASW